MLSLFARLSPEPKAHTLLKELKAKEDERLKRKYLLDPSALIEYLIGTKAGETRREYFETLKPEETANCSILAISEIFYIPCRLRGATFLGIMICAS